MDKKPLEFHLSDNEQVVRDYECTRLTRFLAPATHGYLTITNKRIVYHSQAKSINGTSALISEVPLDDVSGFSTSISATFNWIFFLVFCVVVYLLTSLLSLLLPAFLTGWVISIILVLPYLIGLLFEKNIISLDIQKQFSQNLSELPGGAFLTKKDRNFYMKTFRLIFLIGLALFAWNIVNSTGITFRMPWLSFILLGGSYYLIYRVFFGKIRTFSLAISSKSSKGSGIIIPGNPLSLLWGGNTAAAKSLYAGPGNDAETIVQELGAVLTDIRQMGDLGVKKWIK